ncbi:hypothetical protein OB905_07130 [Halobacteria archaeon AArc-dxtr1]|nr:hypothetical protein [Halobacteria archaeon AArc-dxtr1]
MNANRRDVLGFAGTTAAIATASWLPFDVQTTNDDELPAYSRWLVLEEDALEFTYVDWASVGDYVEDELEEAQQDTDAELPAEYEMDPMIAPASAELLSTYFFVGLDLVEFGLGRLLDEEAFDSTVEELLRTDRTFVAAGTIDPDEIDTVLTDEPALDFQIQMERADEIGGFDVYTPIEAAESAIAVSDDAIVVVTESDVDPEVTLETIVGAVEDDVERATAESASLEWLVETAGRGDVTVGQYGGPFDDTDLAHPAFEPLADAEGFVSSLTIEDEQTVSGIFASILDEPDEDAIEAFLGASADDRDIEVDEDRVTAAGTWLEVD